MGSKLGAEILGTFWLVLGGCGSAVLAAAFPDLGIGFAGVALAFGLTVLTMAFAIGPISGCHLNPAVSIGLWAGNRFNGKELFGYIVAQLIGAILASFVLLMIASGKAGFAISYGLGQGATLIAALWGVLIWKEFKGVQKVTGLLSLMFLFYVIGLALIIAARLY